MAGKKYFYELDILRGIACLLVYFSHLPINKIFGINVPFINGWNGVYLFYIISGFIITVTYDYQIEYLEELNFKDWLNNLRQNKLKIYRFWYNRFIRLFPTIILLFLFLLIVIIIYGIKHHNLSLSLLLYVKYVLGFPFLLGGELTKLGDNESILGTLQIIAYTAQLWSLSGEILCYIIFPLLVCHKKFPIFMLHFIMLSLIIKMVLFYIIPVNIIYFNVLAHLDEFAIGVLIGLFYKKILVNKLLLKIFTVISVLNIVICFTYQVPYITYLSLIISGAFLVYISSLKENFLNMKILGKTMNYIGRRSYFIYLMHMIIDLFAAKPFKYFFKFLAKYSTMINSLVVKNSVTLDHYKNLILLFIVLFFAEIFYRYVEIPFNKKYKNKVFTAAPATA